MKWPSEQICKRIADLWARGNDQAAYSGEKENAFAALKRLPVRARPERRDARLHRRRPQQTGECL